MGQTEVISLDEVRANQHHHQLRQRLHASFDRWFDILEEHMSSKPIRLPERTDVMWELRQSSWAG